MINRIREYFRKRRSDRYFAKMDIIRDRFVKERSIVIGERYRGDYFLGGKRDGTLVCVDASSDGIFAVLKDNEGVLHSDISASSLEKTNEQIL